MNWKPGDRALFLSDIPEADTAKMHGQIVTLVKESVIKNPEGPTPAWIVEEKGALGGNVRVATHCLHPIPGEYDGYETTTWDKVPGFTPKELIRVENTS